MGKGFTLQDTEGHDLADMFHQAFHRKVTLFCLFFCVVGKKSNFFFLI